MSRMSFSLANPFAIFAVSPLEDSEERGLDAPDDGCALELDAPSMHIGAVRRSPLGDLNATTWSDQDAQAWPLAEPRVTKQSQKRIQQKAQSKAKSLLGANGHVDPVKKAAARAQSKEYKRASRERKRQELAAAVVAPAASYGEDDLCLPPLSASFPNGNASGTLGDGLGGRLICRKKKKSSPTNLWGGAYTVVPRALSGPLASLQRTGGAIEGSAIAIPLVEPVAPFVDDPSALLALLEQLDCPSVPPLGGGVRTFASTLLPTLVEGVPFVVDSLIAHGSQPPLGEVELPIQTHATQAISLAHQSPAFNAEATAEAFVAGALISGPSEARSAARSAHSAAGSATGSARQAAGSAPQRLYTEEEMLKSADRARFEGAFVGEVRAARSLNTQLAGLAAHITTGNAGLAAHISTGNAGLAAHVTEAAAGVEAQISAGNAGLAEHITAGHVGLAAHFTAHFTAQIERDRAAEDLEDARRAQEHAANIARQRAAEDRDRTERNAAIGRIEAVLAAAAPPTPTSTPTPLLSPSGEAIVAGAEEVPEEAPSRVAKRNAGAVAVAVSRARGEQAKRSRSSCLANSTGKLQFPSHRPLARRTDPNAHPEVRL